MAKFVWWPKGRIILFITFEGLDGAGKSTQITRLAKRLEESGKRVVCTREPGGTALGDILREILLDPRQENLSPITEVMLYATSRAQLVHEVIRPALQQGCIVLCDRYVDASVAYQGAGLKIGPQVVYEVNRFATQGLVPDVTFLFDIPVETSRCRVENSSTSPDRIERRSHEYFNRVRHEFLRIANDEPGRVIVLDATKTPGELEEEIWRHVANRVVP
jgi:dTMP kinase